MGGETYYNPTTGKVVMQVLNPNLPNYPENAWRVTVHEMKHGFQFLSGKVSFNKTTGDNGTLCDIEDEVEAYKRECIIADQRFYGTFNIKAIKVSSFIVNALSVIAYGNTFTPSLGYQDLPTISRDITTSEGINLINQGANCTEIFVQP